MDKFVVKSKRPADVEDSNSKNDETKNQNQAHLRQNQTQKYMASRGYKIKRPRRPFFHFYLSVYAREALFAIKNVVPTRIKYIPNTCMIQPMQCINRSVF